MRISDWSSDVCSSDLAQVPALLEAYNVPYVFSDPLTLSVTLDKAVAKRLVREAGLPTAPFAVIESDADARACPLPYPLFVKPLAGGRSEARRVGKECVCTCRSRCAPFP